MYREPAGEDPEAAQTANVETGPLAIVIALPRVRVSLGNVYATPGALQALNWANLSPLDLLRRHALGDWGELDAEDWKANDRAAVQAERILSNYPLPSGTRIWIITEADRTSTTLLLPEEY